MAGNTRFIGRVRAPRVQIAYEVELYGAAKNVELPFVVGVMSDLSGMPTGPRAPLADRKFLEISVDNFDERLASVRPRLELQVPNLLDGGGPLRLELLFETLDDFSPGSVARTLPGTRALLEARKQLANLVVYLDGKSDAEALLATWLQDPNLLAVLASASTLAEANSDGAELSALLQKHFRPQSERARAEVESAVLTLARHTRAPAPEGSDPIEAIQSLIATLDAKLSAQLNVILHDAAFQALEEIGRASCRERV